MYGYRARIGYTSPPVATEIFPYEFYKIVPEGVTLVIGTLAVTQMTSNDLERSYELSLELAKEFARVKVDLVCLGGIPVNVLRGIDKVDELIKDTEAAIGVPVTTSLTAQIAALRAVGARKVGLIHPFPDSHHDTAREYLDFYKIDCSGVMGANKTIGDLGRMSVEAAMEIGRRMKAEHPATDTLWYIGPHWPVSAGIEALERELGINVIGANQAIVWDGLRHCKVDDRINGFGRLLREH